MAFKYSEVVVIIIIIIIIIILLNSFYLCFLIHTCSSLFAVSVQTV